MLYYTIMCYSLLYEVQNVEKRGGSYGAAADLWSVGVMLYVMLCGKYPFDDNVRAEKRLVDAAFEDIYTYIYIYIHMCIHMYMLIY